MPALEALSPGPVPSRGLETPAAPRRPVSSGPEPAPRSFDAPLPLHEVSFVVVDVETTGGSPNLASLTEVAAARYHGGELLGTYQTFVRPDHRIPPFITLLTGISDAMVAGAPRAGEILPSLLEFIGTSVLVGHNLRFDVSFLDHALTSTERSCLANPCVDTLALARRLVGRDTPNCRLGTLAACLHLEHHPTHRALDDVLATGDLLHVLLEQAGSFGIVDLEELVLLPELLGHPQAGKLRASARLPRRPGVYWFVDPRGRVLFVESAADIRRSARRHFLVRGDRRTNRLLRQLHDIGYRRQADPAEALALQKALLDRHDPLFNRPQHRSSAGRAPASPPTPPLDAAPDGARHGQRMLRVNELGPPRAGRPPASIG